MFLNFKLNSKKGFMDRQALQERYGITGNSEAIKQVVDKIMQVSHTDITVLLQGESGVGKDVSARTIHALSQRKRNDLVIVNCGAIPEGIIESELFGHEKGSFTGAHEARKGYFEKADGGTIFLDEIGDTPKNIQVKLLRVLESGEFFRVGSSKMYKADVRVIAATNQDLWQLVQEGDFREDLYYRLDTVKIKLPPLRNRKEDIIPIFKEFVEEFSAKYDSVFQGFSDEAKELLISYRWPGNVRELRNVAEQLVVLEKSQFIDKDKLQKYLKGRQHHGSTDNLPILSREEKEDPFDSSGPAADNSIIYRALLEMSSDISDLKKMLAKFLYSTFTEKGVKALPSAISRDIDPNDISSHISEDFDKTSLGVSSPQPAAGKNPVIEEDDNEDDEEVIDFFKGKEIPSIEEAEKFLIEQSLRRYDGNRRKASEALGVSERTLYRKLDQYGLQ